MADTRRILRLQQLMLETMATALQQQVEDPRVKGVTITRVTLARDMTTGVVYWSNLESGGPRRTAERGLTDVIPYLQALVAEALATRQTPRLTLRFDEHIERAARLGDLFAKLAKERGDLPETSGTPTADGAAKADEGEAGAEDDEDADDKDNDEDEDEEGDGDDEDADGAKDDKGEGGEREDDPDENDDDE